MNQKHSPARDHATAFLLSTKEAARLMGLSHRTLEDWRLRGGGPAFKKLGRTVRYAYADLMAFIDGGTRANTGGALAA